MDLLRSLAPFAVAAVLWSAPFVAFAQPANVVGSVEEVRAVSTDIAANDDGSFMVVERVQYAMPGAGGALSVVMDMRPIGDGTGSAISVEELSVRTADGAPLAFTSSEDADGHALRVRIDDPAVMTSGVHDLVVSYVVRGAIVRNEDVRELEWRAVSSWEEADGSGTTSIRRASVTVRAPASTTSGITSHTCSAGEIGGVTRDCLVQVQGGTAFFAGDGPMAIGVVWIKGDANGKGSSGVGQDKRTYVIVGLFVVAILYAASRRRT